MIQIDLQTPGRVNAQPVRQQSLWLLLRMWWAAQPGQRESSGGWVRESELRARFPGARHVRMLVSRAFADFAQWGVCAGWGLDPQRDPQVLPLGQRSRGPFWLAADQLARLRIHVGAQAAQPRQIAEWLQLGADLSAVTGTASASAHAAAPEYWHAWADARRDMLDGALIAANGRGALAGYRRAQQLAADPWLAALALLQQAMVWRRAGNADAARRVLDELDRHWQDRQQPQHAWLGAMAAVVRAWCAYAGRDLVGAGQVLQQAIADPRWAQLFQYHPRLRSEQANLQALIQRARALDPAASAPQRQQAALDAIRYYQQALALASEAELFEAAASAASNLGWSLWLFARTGLEVGLAGAAAPLSWIGLCAWLEQRYQVGGGCWNRIYLLRIARDGGPGVAHPELQQLRAWPVLAPAAFVRLIAPMQLQPPPADWLQLALQLQQEVEGGRLQVDALQRANVLLEVAWYSAHAGQLPQAQQAAAALRRRLRELNPADRGFFRDALRALPELV